MNCFVYRLLPFGFSIVVIVFLLGVSQAQDADGYRVHWLDLVMPPEATRITVKDLKVNEDENFAIVVGSYDRNDRPGRQAFVYDHLGFIDPNQPQKFWDIQELVGPNPPSWAPSTHVESRFVGVNRHGRLCGYIWSADGDYMGVFFDLNSQHQELQPLPSTSMSATECLGWRVNELGDILLIGETNGSFQQPEISIYNPDSNPPEKIDVPVSVNSIDDIYFNALRQILGVIPGSVPWSGSTFGSGVFRHTAFDTDNDGISDGVTEQFFDLTQPAGLNDFAQFSCIQTFTIPKNRKQVRYEHHAARIGATGLVEWETGSGTWDQVSDLNNSGDLLHLVEDGNLNTTPYMFYEGNPETIDDDQPFFDFTSLIFGNELASGNETRYQKLSDRDHTGLGWILGTTDIDGDGVRETFLLVPESLEPTPGISVTPTSGLTTTEAIGDPATFTVVLDTEPTADVTIGTSSDDITEGTVDPANLTFTPLNWNIPRTVTVTGVDDTIQDGDVAYTITTAAATSTDPNYYGLDAADVSVTNEDDDGPPTGGSESYGSVDTPLAIPDNNPAGVASTILAGDHTITNLTVNVDITHQRPSDLEVYLTGPDNGPPVELFNFSGDNNVPDFNGTSSLGLWTLEVYDVKKKKTGTLNSWSITVDY